MDIRETVLRQLKNHREGFSLEQPFYIDQDYFRLDMEMIWYRDWLFMGHDCEIPRAGNYFTVQIGDYPVVIVRGRDKIIRAFHNTCRHRGHRVCTAQKGASAKLVCPYHQWTYDLDGSWSLPSDGRGFRQGAVRHETGALRKRRRLHLHLSCG